MPNKDRPMRGKKKKEIGKDIFFFLLAVGPASYVTSKRTIIKNHAVFRGGNQVYLTITTATAAIAVIINTKTASLSRDFNCIYTFLLTVSFSFSNKFDAHYVKIVIFLPFFSLAVLAFSLCSTFGSF